MMSVLTFLRIIGFLSLTVPLMPVQYAFTKVSPRFARHFPNQYHRCLAALLGIRIRVQGGSPTDGPVLLVANHASWIDIIALSAVLPVSFIAKREVAGWPLFGQMAKLQRTVFVDRARRHHTGRHRNEIAHRLNKGDVLVLFPEGTSYDGLNVLEFKSALLAAAESEGVRVVPVTLAYDTANGLPMTRRQRPAFAWYGDMELAPHIWAAIKSGPIGITVKFHEASVLREAGGRKTVAQAAQAQISESLARILSRR